MIDFQLVNPENPDKCDPSKSQWYLDPYLAARIAEWALRPYNDGMVKTTWRALEPSAGRGALAMVLRAFVKSVTCVDIDPQNAEYLGRCGFETHEADFLQLHVDTLGAFHIAVLNPPFEGGQTEEHILHALDLADRAVCHCPLTTLAGQDRRAGLWSQAYLKRLVIHASRPKYSGNKNGGMTDMCTIDVVRRPELHPVEVSASGVNVEWWQ